ncbi:TPA: hypothetical protein DEP86_02240, partial [Candidatus Uhrbacteria bacterium]|nr:hypothetical protein [Candidatus Uhrbacteria bacterium]
MKLDENSIPDDISAFPISLNEKIGSVITDEGLIFVDDTLADWGGRSAPENEKNRRIGTSVGTDKLLPIWLILLVGLIVVLIRCGQIQIIKRAQFAALAEGNRSRIERIPAERGVVFDRNDLILVQNMPKFTATVIPSDLPTNEADRRLVLGRLAEIVELTPRDIEEKLIYANSLDSVAVPIAEDINHEQAILVEIMSSRWMGVQLLRGTKREYPQATEISSMSHIIGFESGVTAEDVESGDFLPTDRIGRTGLERSYETELRGKY